MNVNEAEEALGYVFKNKLLLERALTLPSVAGKQNNQTLEFFGDAILEFVVSEKIFDIASDEGYLTERRKTLVSDTALGPVSRSLGLDKLLVKSSGDNDNKKAIPSAYEAVCAAIYLDGGIDAAKNFILRTLNFDSVRIERDYKSELQVIMQAQKPPQTPEYSTSNNIGTDKKPKFSSSVTAFGKIYTGVAGSKLQAEKNAAKAALDNIDE